MFVARDENENFHSNWRENLKQMARHVSHPNKVSVSQKEKTMD